MTKAANDEQGFAHIWLLFAAVLLVVGGAGYVVMRHNQSTQVNRGAQTTSTSSVKPLSTNLDGLLTTAKVQQIAAQDAPSTKVAQIGLAQSTKGPVFHVQLEDGSSFDLDAKTGTKVSDSGVGDDTEGAKIPASFTPAISFAKAEQIAQTQVTSGSIVRIELETEENTTVYSVRFSTGSKVLVNATTGGVVKVSAANAQGKQPTSSGDTSGGKVESGSTSDGSKTSEPNETTAAGSGSSETGSGTSGSGSSSGGSASGSTTTSAGSDDSGSGGH